MKVVRCLLVRKFFNPFKSKQREYNGCLLTLANFTDNTSSSSDGMTTCQSIDIKPSIQVQDIIKRKLRKEASNFGGERFSDEQLSLASAVWSMAESVNWCSLVAGGWDEVAPATMAEITVVEQGIVVDVPMTDFDLDPKYGYIRFRGRINDLTATFHSIHQRNTRRFFPGMLDQRPCRKQFGNVKYGELLFIDPEICGITLFSLASLHWAVCQEVKIGTSNNLQHPYIAPSMVRAVRGTFLGISYCRAIAQCTKCFSTLRLRLRHHCILILV
jgi:hypothetical protein